MNSNASITSDGTLVTTPAIYGTDSETLGHTQPFERLMLRSDFQAKVDYNRTFGKHQVGGALIYDMQSVVKNGRNNSQKNQSVLVNATYTYDNRYSLYSTARDQLTCPTETNTRTILPFLLHGSSPTKHLWKR